MTSSGRCTPSLEATGTHYDTLGIKPSADAQEIRRAYRSLARALHPDHQQQAPPALAEQAQVRMGEVNAAWAVLSNPSAKELYDLELRLARSRAGGEAATGARSSPGSGPGFAAPAAEHRRNATAAPRFATLDDEPLRYGTGSNGHPIVRSLLWLVVLGTLAAIFVFTAYAASDGDDAPTSTTTTTTVVQAAAGDCVNATVPNAFDLVSCTGPHDARIVELVPIGRPCPNGAQEVYLPEQHESACLVAG